MTGRRDAKSKWRGRVGLGLGFALFCGGQSAVAAGPMANNFPVVKTAAPSPVQAEISHLGDTAHLEFRGLKNWRYEVTKSGDKAIVLNVPAFDEVSLVKLQGYRDALVDKVQVDKQGPDGTFNVTFTLAQKDVESFDYLTDDPSRLILDFYRKVEVDVKKPQAQEAGAGAAAGKAKKKTAAKKTNSSNEQAGEGLSHESAVRKPAGDEILSVDNKPPPDSTALHFGIFDGGDDNYDRFRIKDYEIREDAIIASRQNFYLPFPMLKMKVSLLDRLMEQQPEYAIHPKENRENKEARLLLTLAERKRDGLFFKTYDYFMNKYPESEYKEILNSLAAHIHLRRWKDTGSAAEFDQARALYGELVAKYPASPLREYNYLILGFAQMERGDALNTLQTFQGFLQAYPKSPEVPAVHSAIAEAYMILRKYDEAVSQYQAIIKEFPHTAFANEARFRLGDVDFAKGDFSQSIRSYELAIKDLKGQEKVYPNATFNMAEARFWQKDYKKALDNYVQFVNLFPTHDYGGYALTRIGELLGIMGADQRRVMGAFLESYFRFPNHPGAKIARIRMLSQQMKGMKPKELKKAIAEIEETSQKLDLKNIEEFTTLIEAEGLSHRGEYKTAIDNLITYYQKFPKTEDLPLFQSRIRRNIANELKDEVDRGDFMDALKFDNQYSTTWLRNIDRIDIPFFLGRAFESAGVNGEAEKIYRAALAHREAIVGTDVEKEKKVQEYLPSVATLHLRLAAVLTEDRNYIEAYQQLKEIGAQAALSPAETVERVQLIAQIAEQRNDFPRAREALTELAQKWQGDPALVAPVHLKLAETFNKMSDFKAAEAHADKALEAEGKGEAPIADKVIEGALAAKAEAELGQKKTLAAVETYQNLLQRFEDKMPLANTRYKLGQILFDRGDLKGAAEVWQPLQNPPNELLWKIGKEKLDQNQWQTDYTKYMNRIPAMAGGSGAKEKAQ